LFPGESLPARGYFGSIDFNFIDWLKIMQNAIRTERRKNLLSNIGSR
jgi:hypothetical protein